MYIESFRELWSVFTCYSGNQSEVTWYSLYKLMLEFFSSLVIYYSKLIFKMCFIFYLIFFLLFLHSIYSSVKMHIDSFLVYCGWIYRWDQLMWLMKASWVCRTQPDGHLPPMRTQLRHSRQRDVVTHLYQLALRHRQGCLPLSQCVLDRQRNVGDSRRWRLNLLRVASPAEIRSTRRTPLYTTSLQTLAR